MRLLRGIDRLLVRLETVLLVAFLGTMIVLAFAQVVMRNLFGAGFLWGDPLVRQMVLWAGFIGAAVAASEDRHISIDAVTKFFSPRLKSVTKVVTSLAAAVITAYLASAALTFLADERETSTTIIEGLPSWIGLLIIPVGYALITIHFVLVALEHGVALVRRDPVTRAGKGA
jgi:TRAP-type C4-dicarboxylate transport system permease small subunit